MTRLGAGPSAAPSADPSVASSVATEPVPAAGPALADVPFPGATAQLRAAFGVAGPADVPIWMTRGGSAARAAAAAMAADSAAVRRVAMTVGSVLGDTAGALGWQGRAASAAQARALQLRSDLLAIATQLDAAQAAFTGLAAALDAQQAAIGSPAATWGRATPDRQLALLRQWLPAVHALDTADARAATAVGEVVTALATVHVHVGSAGVAPPSPALSGAAGHGPVDDAVYAVGTFCRAVVNALASVANAASHEPGDATQLVAGLLLMQVGGAGEVAGGALDATGIGAAVGVPAGVASAGVIAAGAGLAAVSAGRLAQHAATDDRVTPLQMAGDRPAGAPGPDPGPSVGGPALDIEGATFAQRTARLRFSDDGIFAGRTIDDVAASLRRGVLTPDDVPIDVIVRDGKVLILNTRSSLALQEAGIPRSAWHLVDRTGEAAYEGRLARQLSTNQLDSTGIDRVRLRGRGE
jgi:hypothetical protein